MSAVTTLRSARLQLARLQRHYELAVRTYDEISLLDLAHSLRAVVDLKRPLEETVPRVTTTLRFQWGTPTSKAMRAVRGSEYVIAHMPGGTITFAHGGEISAREQERRLFGTSTAVRRNADGSMDLFSFGYVTKGVEPEGILEAKQMRGSLGQWLGAEAVRLAYPVGGALRAIGVGREVLIRRVANVLGGSHPESHAGEAQSPFDPAVRYLMEHRVGGLPLPYFLVMKAAQDVLEIVPDLLPDT